MAAILNCQLILFAFSSRSYSHNSPSRVELTPPTITIEQTSSGCQRARSQYIQRMRSPRLTRVHRSHTFTAPTRDVYSAIENTRPRMRSSYSRRSVRDRPPNYEDVCTLMPEHDGLLPSKTIIVSRRSHSYTNRLCEHDMRASTNAAFRKSETNIANNRSQEAARQKPQHREKRRDRDTDNDQFSHLFPDHYRVSSQAASVGFTISDYAAFSYDSPVVRSTVDTNLLNTHDPRGNHRRIQHDVTLSCTDIPHSNTNRLSVRDAERRQNQSVSLDGLPTYDSVKHIRPPSR